MNYEEALEFAIDRTRERIDELGDQALDVRERDEDSDTMEKWAALRSAQGGMMECLDMMTQVQAMAKSYDADNQSSCENCDTLYPDGSGNYQHGYGFCTVGCADHWALEHLEADTK